MGYAVHTAITASVISGAVLMVIGFVGAPFALNAMGTPEDIVGFATLYMRIYFLGTIANLIYNIGSGILRAVGDSKRPLYFLIASCFANIILDIVFVVYFHMGIAGAALATIISQCVSAFSISITIFVGQNYGAGKMDRVRKGIRVCLGMSFVTTLFLSLFLYNFGQYIFQIFTTDPAVLTIGMDVLHYLVPTFFTYIIIEIYSDSLKGIGDSWFPMFLTMTGVCALRVLWLLLYVPSHHNIHAIIFTYPMTWVVTSILFLIYFHGFSPMRKIR